MTRYVKLGLRSVFNTNAFRIGRQGLRLGGKRLTMNCLRLESLEPRALMAGDLAVNLTNSISVQENTYNDGFIIGGLYPAFFSPDATVNYQVLSVDGDTLDDRIYAFENRLLARGMFDFETKPFHEVLIRANASDGTFCETFVQVTVWDRNDDDSSPLSLSIDSVFENAGSEGLPLAIGELGVRDQAGLQFELITGTGDVDNADFSIEGSTLFLDSIPNVESQWLYSIRVRATTESGVVDGILNVDVLPVSEYSPDRILPFDMAGDSLVFLRIAENTPVGQSVATLRTINSDLFETFEYSLDGALAPYLRVESNHLIVNAPIDYESVSLGPMDLTINGISFATGESIVYFQGGFGGNSSGFLPSVIDVNDPPLLAELPDQSTIAGLEMILPLEVPLYTDQDAVDQGELAVTVAIGEQTPDWLAWDHQANGFVVSANAMPGVYEVIVSVTDSGNKSDSGSFVLTIAEPVLLEIDGTSNDDLFTVRALGTGANAPWRINVNGQVAFEGTIAPGTFLQMNGGAGNDTLRILAGGGDNQLFVGANYVRLSDLWFLSPEVEVRSLRGQAGADTFTIQSNITDVLTIDGGGGPDTLGVESVAAEWNLLDRGSGSVNGVGFSSIRSLVGSDQDDTFSIARSGELIGTIDGGGGWNQLVYAANSRRVDTTITSFETLSGESSRLGGFSNIDLVSAMNSQNNSLTYTNESLLNLGDLVLWNIGASNLSIEIRSQFDSSVVFSDFFNADGFTRLSGTLAPDQFVFTEMVENPIYNIDGGDTSFGTNYVNYQQGPVFVNLQNSSATGMNRFSRIVQFAAEDREMGGVVIGPNARTEWDVFADGAILSNAPSFIFFHTYQGGSSDDLYRFYDGIGSLGVYPVIDGGLGRNELDFSAISQGVVVDLTQGSTSITWSVSSFSDVVGTAYDDILIGDVGNNRLFGAQGNDLLKGEGGNDLLFGGAGDDTLMGGEGNDWLLGGSGADVLIGGLADDLLISDRGQGFENESDLSRNAYNLAAIQVVFAEWTSSRSYLHRVQRLLNGVGPGNSIRLSSTTLSSDSEVDSLFGEEGNDWFWADLQDQLPDRRNAERLHRT